MFVPACEDGRQSIEDFRVGQRAVFKIHVERVPFPPAKHRPA